MLQVAVVCLGLALQGLAPEPALAAGLTTAATPAPSDWTLRLLGVACMLLSSLSYSFLGVSYDLLVRSEGATPTHSEVMFYTAKIGELFAKGTLLTASCVYRYTCDMMHKAALCLCCCTSSATSDVLLKGISHDINLNNGLRLETTKVQLTWGCVQPQAKVLHALQDDLHTVSHRIILYHTIHHL